MIRILIYDDTLLPLYARVYITNGTELILHTEAIDGEIYLPEPSKFIEGGRYMIRIRYCTHAYCFKPMEFYIDREDGEDLHFCVRMELD